MGKKGRNRIVVPAAFVSKPTSRPKDEAPKPQRTVNEKLSLLRKFGKRSSEPDPAELYSTATPVGVLDNSVLVLPPSSSRRTAAGPVPKSWAQNQAQTLARKELDKLRGSFGPHRDEIGPPSLRRLCCEHLASRLKDLMVSAEMTSLWFYIPIHLRDEILLHASSRTRITDRMLRTFWVGELPSRTIDVAGGNVTVAGLQRILPERIKAASKKGFLDEESEELEANEATLGSWEDAESDSAWSDDDFEIPDKLAEAPRAINVSFCSLDPMQFAWTLADRLPLLSSLNVAGALRGQFAGAALLHICRNLINLQHLDVSASPWLKQELAEEAILLMETKKLESFAALLCPITDTARFTAIAQSKYPACRVLV